MSNAETAQLCAEIRKTLIETVGKTGGHLASNLGIVELTVAIHKTFNAPADKIIFDVGHQSYVHKILTGRYEKMPELRKKGGISGFTRRSESEYDPFGSGHSGNAVSAGLGFAEANRMDGKNDYVVCVVGDGSFTNGMVLEAKEQLSLLVKDAGNLDASLYTASTYALLQSEVNESNNLIAQDTATLEQVVEAQVKLVNAKNALIDLSGLKSVVEQSNYVKDEYTKNSYRTYETALNQAKPVLENANSTAEEIQKAQEDLENAIQALVKKADFSILNEKVQEGYAFLESDKDMLEEASYMNFKNELDACSVILANDESTQDEINDSLARLNAYFENKDNFVYKVMTLENNVVVEPQKQMLDTPQLVVQEQVNTVQSVQTPSPKATTSAADNFIKTYLTSASGNVFTTANYLNYQKILSAMPSWLKLSSPDQKAVNAELKNKVGKTYQKLLQEAQNLKMNSGTSINTATNTDSTLYTWLCVMSLGMLTFVTKRLRKQD